LTMSYACHTESWESALFGCPFKNMPLSAHLAQKGNTNRANSNESSGIA
jgi:hypothetical protein